MRVAPGTRRGVVGAVASFGGLGAAFAAGASPSVGVLAAWEVGATVFLDYLDLAYLALRDQARLALVPVRHVILSVTVSSVAALLGS